MMKPAWVILSGFSVNASSFFMIDIDRNVGDFGHTVVWELSCSIVILYRHMSLIFK